MIHIGSLSSSYKLILAVGTTTRPKYRSLLLGLLRPFVRDGEFSIRYRCYEGFNRSYLRISDLAADVLSTRELCVSDAYRLEREFRPEQVVDGGGNIGLFTLRAAAAYGRDARYVICEPVPRNLAQIEKHLQLNGVRADIVSACLGGSRRTIPFYCRGANEGSFDPSLPYDSVLNIPVVLLEDVVEPSAERILIKLDIEGMEMETLAAYLPTEKRPVYVVGELHDRPKNAPVLERMFRDEGWTLELFDVDEVTCSFRGCSPSAVPLLSWAMALDRPVSHEGALR
ncbi:MAG: FkbM family methyltransferase [Acidobacteriaceae bacterium]